ncbi:hypothetical protein EMQ_1522 [Acetobacter aceti NBRC 14818]|uniref:Lipoprotein n=1 Tax=Acetobacter aceti NBRC 14818 TaxID=887700 RepID=A0AB33IGG7_ACEAC|nr:hypothetical protein EMQ_1522 [Acetobacter aceti NBRC 14818]GAN58517.1 hypothetical protein Abac_055_039 [Acetobacter aceti NBRC 14818]
MAVLAAGCASVWLVCDETDGEASADVVSKADANVPAMKAVGSRQDMGQVRPEYEQRNTVVPLFPS